MQIDEISCTGTIAATCVMPAAEVALPVRASVRKGVRRFAWLGKAERHASGRRAGFLRGLRVVGIVPWVERIGVDGRLRAAVGRLQYAALRSPVTCSCLAQSVGCFQKVELVPAGATPKVAGEGGCAVSCAVRHCVCMLWYLIGAFVGR